VPLSPETAELFKYNDMPVSMMTGVPQISYPLYEINTGKIKLPLSLSYHASGIKVTQRATWVGLGWSLAPGGSIGRAVRGNVDENESYGWFNHMASLDTIPLIQSYYAMLNWVNNTPDPQPDFFDYSFSGKSGRFIYSRTSKSFVTIPYQPVLIKRIAADNTYQITDDDGTRYFFERKKLVTNDTQGFQQYVQEWNLTRIISDDSSDTLYLNYDYPATSNPDWSMEVATTFSRDYSIKTGQVNYTRSEMTSSTSQSHYDASKLKEIVFRQGKVTFYANTVRNDYGNNLLDSIVVYSKDGAGYQRVKKVSFAYNYFFDGNTSPGFVDYRLKLLSFTTEDINGGQPEKYQFGYVDTPIPSITSFAADYWGFYNGAISNSSLMPNIEPQDAALSKYGTLGDANRQPSDSFIMAGLLNKITYPTGGYTTLKFEPNKYIKSWTNTIDTTLGALRIYGGGRTATTTQTVNFKTVSTTGASTAWAAIHFTLSAFSANPVSTAESVVFKDSTTGTSIQSWTSDLYSDYQNAHIIDYAYECNTSHVYQLTATVKDLVTTYIDAYIAGTTTDFGTQLYSGGGIRVQSISSYNTDSTLQKQEVYKYAAGETGIGNMPFSPDETIYNNYYGHNTGEAQGSGTVCTILTGQKITFVGQLVYPNVSFQGADVLYPYVTRYEYGNNVPNGKTIYQYNLPNDYVVIPTPGSLGGKERINNTLFDEQLHTVHTYKYNAVDSSYRLLKQVTNSYGLYNFNTEKGYQLWSIMEWLTAEHCNAEFATDFNYMVYNIKSGGYRLTGTKQQEYDDNGILLEDSVVYTYNNYALPSKIWRMNSKKDSVYDIMYYPGEHAVNDPNAVMLNQMVRRNMIRQPYWKGNYKNGVLLSYQRTMYDNLWGTNDSLIAPKTDSLWAYGSNDGVPVSTVSYQAYGKYGNITQMTDPKGVPSSYTWTADGTYPVSQTIGANINEVLYNGFEDAGNWTGVTSDATQVYSGRYAGMITNAGTATYPGWINVSLSAATKFKFSGWVYSNGPGATINLMMKKSGETAAYSYIDNISTSQIGKWVYVEKEYAVPADVKTLSIRIDNNGTGKVWFDDIKLRPSVAQMNTYTYTPLVGMTSKNDEGNHIVYYEYDGLGRLKVIRDKDRNILKTFSYNYTIQ
jgi:YD repeat-containing protein